MSARSRHTIELMPSGVPGLDVVLGGGLPGEKVLAVVKMRSSRHATDIRRYTIGTSGAIVADAEDCSRSVLTGLPILTSGEARTLSGLTADEVTLLHSLRALGASAARELSRRTGLKGVTLSRALARLQQLESVRTVRRAGVVSYRALS